jgi:hypothetical protein
MSTGINASTAPSQFEFIEIDPDSVWIADGRRRRPLNLKDEQDLLLIDNIRKTPGNRYPIEVRATPLAAKPYELITGRRRLAACKYLGRPVLAKIIPLSDEKLEWYALTENTLRRQMSPVEVVKAVKGIFREMERIWGPDPGRAVGGRARASKASRGGAGDSLGGSGKFAADSRLEPAQDGPDDGTKPATPESGVAGSNGESTPASAATSQSHHRRYREATGRSQSLAFEDATLANAFNDEELRLLAAKDLTREQLVKLAHLDKEGKDHAITLMAMGNKPDDAIEQGRALATAPPVPLKERREQDLTDEEWLFTWCAPVRDQLQDTRYFDNEAIYYRKTREERHDFRAQVRDIVARHRSTRYYELILVDIRCGHVEHPNDWFVCSMCQGRNVDKPECDHCLGNGYKVRYGSPKRR